MGNYECRALNSFNDVSHSKGFAAACYALENLCSEAVFDAVDELVDGLRLVARGFIIADELEFRHSEDFLVGGMS